MKFKNKSVNLIKNFSLRIMRNFILFSIFSQKLTRRVLNKILKFTNNAISHRLRVNFWVFFRLLKLKNLLKIEQFREVIYFSASLIFRWNSNVSWRINWAKISCSSLVNDEQIYSNFNDFSQNWTIYSKLNILIKIEPFTQNRTIHS